MLKFREEEEENDDAVEDEDDEEEDETQAVLAGAIGWQGKLGTLGVFETRWGLEVTSGDLLAIIRPCSLSTTSTNRLNAWAFSSTLSVILSVTSTIFCLRSRASLLLWSILLATVWTADLSSSKLCCFVNTRAGWEERVGSMERCRWSGGQEGAVWE